MISPFALHFPWPVIQGAAINHALDPLLIAAFIGVENQLGISAVTRFEKDYRWLVKPEFYAGSLGISLATEIMAQSHSYGLMQIMGGTARSLGYHGYLSQLIDPAAGLHYACDYLVSLMGRFPKIEDAISAYNEGSPHDNDHDGKVDNHEYVDHVMRNYAKLKQDAAAV